MPRYRSVRESIFLSVSLLLTSVLLVFSLLVYDYASAVAKDRFSEALITLSRSIMANLDAQVSEMNRLSLTLIYSRVFQGQYARHLSLPRFPASVEQRIEKLENTEALIEIGDTILGPNQSAPQINVYDTRGEMIGAGFYSRLIERDASREPWYAEVMEAKGGRVMYPPHADILLEETSVIVKGKRYVSLLRSFSDSLLSTRGIVEVEQYCDSIFGGLNVMTGSAASIFVFDEGNNFLYPYDSPPAEGSAILRIAGEAAKRGTVTSAFPGSHAQHIFAAALSRETGWTLLIGEPAAGLSASVFQYAARIAILTLAAILCSLAASYFIARRVTVPLKALHAEIESFDPRNLHEPKGGARAADLGEIDELRLAFHDMRLNLNESIREAVALRNSEREAQLVALQSQLNPHFLHNMLQTIAIMAEEGPPAAIQDLIQNLTRMLRYASSSGKATATLGTEVEYAENYLAAMRARFGDSFSYEIDVPAGMRGIEVPRLILQPIIENSLKYATAGRPPWRIEIRAIEGEGHWSIEILDNGPGFAPDTLASIRERLGAFRGTGHGLSPMSISGMGILNSHERFRLTFGEAFSFEVGNRPEGGARVLMGA